MWKPKYVDVAAAKEYLRIPVGDTQDDARLELDIEAASRAIDRATKRQFGKPDTAVERRFTVRWDQTTSTWFASITDLMDLTDLVVVCGTATDFELFDLNAAVDGEPFTEIRFTNTGGVDKAVGGLRITSPGWGWTAVPDTIVDATLLQMARFFKRSDAPFGVAGSPETGSEMRLLAKVDPDVAVMVADYVREWWAA